MTMMLVTAFLLGRCSAPDAAAAPAPQPVEFTYGATPDVQLVDAVLVEQYLSTTTTVAVQRPATTVVRGVPQVPVVPPVAPGSDRWDQLAQCESGQNWSYPPVAGGFSGGLMFHIGTWLANGGGDYAPDAWLATREQQIDIAERVLARSGWGAWPGCSRKFGWL